MARRLVSYTAGIAIPAILTLVLSTLSTTEARDYSFVYLAVVATLGVTSGFWPAVTSALVSFLLIDYFFIPPVHTFTFAAAADLTNLIVFVAVGAIVGTFGSKRREAQLRASQLADEVSTQNSELERLNREQAEAVATELRLAQTQQQVRVLEETDKIRRDLLANVSHELRTPLGTILTGVSGQIDRPDVPEDMKDELEIVVTQTERLRRLVGDMLDMARIQGHALALRLNDVDVREAIEASADRLRASKPKRTVVTDVPDDTPEVLADWDRIGQVLDNLLANADTHSPSEKPISVRATADPDGYVTIHVEDQGPGVSPDLKPHLFERFMRGESDQSGTGLGLSICKGLVEAHAGKIWLDDANKGSGAHFAFTLPRTTSRSSDST